MTWSHLEVVSDSKRLYPAMVAVCSVTPSYTQLLAEVQPRIVGENRGTYSSSCPAGGYLCNGELLLKKYLT